MTITFANDKTITHKGDGLQFIAMAPDMCKTPTPGGPVPMPYPNFAFSSDLSEGSRTVKVEGNPAALASSNLKMSTGDEAGTAGGGIISNKIKGKLGWILYSTDVKFEGKGVVRFLDANLHNGNHFNEPGKNEGRLERPRTEDPILCNNCNEPVWAEHHVELKPSDRSDREAEKAKGRTAAAVVVECPKPGGGVSRGVTTAQAGGMHHELNVDSFTDMITVPGKSKPVQRARNYIYDTPIPKKVKPDTDHYPPGNCAEQRAVYDAHKAGYLPLKEGCNFSISAYRKEKKGNVNRPEPICTTCQRVLVSMMCNKKPPNSETPPLPANRPRKKGRR